MSLDVIMIERHIRAARSLAARLEMQGYRIVGLAETVEDALIIAEGETPDYSVLRVTACRDVQLQAAAKELLLTYDIPTLYFVVSDPF